MHGAGVAPGKNTATKDGATRRKRAMKEGIHPNYRDVCFVDLSNGFKFVTRSCVNTKEMAKHDDGKK